jgi:hypothetical protein
MLKKREGEPIAKQCDITATKGAREDRASREPRGRIQRDDDSHNDTSAGRPCRRSYSRERYVIWCVDGKGRRGRKSGRVTDGEGLKRDDGGGACREGMDGGWIGLDRMGRKSCEADGEGGT